MDNGKLAEEVTSSIVPFLIRGGIAIAEKIGRDAWDIVDNKFNKLYETVKNKLNDNDYASQTLKRFEEKPKDKGRQSAMKSVLEEALVDDKKFQKLLSQLLEEINRAGGKEIINNSGAVATNNSKIIIANNSAGRDKISIYGREFNEK